MPIEYFGHAEDREKRVFRDGHGMRKVDNDDLTFKIICEGKDENGVICGWYTFGSKAQPEHAEYAAWLHRTKPSLLISGTSDVAELARKREWNPATMN